MGIFTQSLFTNNTPEIDHDVQPTLEGMMQIVQESRGDMYRLEAGMYISDTMIEGQVMEGASFEPLFESFVGNVFTKMKEIWMKIWKKVKSWFTTVINKFKAMTMSGEKFINEFGSKLKDKSSVGFKYQGHKWDFKAFESAIDEIGTKAEEEYTKLYSRFEKIAANIESATSLDVDPKKIGKETEDGIKKAYGSYGRTYAAVAEKLTKIAKGDKTETVEIENFGHISVDTMIEVVKEGKNEIARLNRAMKEEDEAFKEVISAIEDAASETIKGAKVDTDATDDAKKKFNEGLSKATAILSASSSAMEKFRSLKNQFAGLQVKLFDQYYKECQGVLKKFLSYKPTKESAIGFDEEPEAENLLEAAMNLL